MVSLNIDVANLPREAIEKLVELAPQQGRVAISHAFGDFRREDMDDLAVQLYQFGFRLIHCPAWPTQRGRLKSVVDDVMAQDLRDQMEYAPNIEVFILGSGDRNFIAVANALKRHGKRVVVAADQESINRELRLCADEFLALPRNRGRQTPRPFLPPEPEPEIVFPSDEELVEQLGRMAESNGYLTLRRILRAFVPENGAGGERARTALTNRIQAMIESGHLQPERRLVKGRMVNTLVVSPLLVSSKGDGPDAPALVELPEAKPQVRRRARRKASVPASS